MSDDPNSSGTRSGDSTSTVPTDDSPEPPKRGCRKRGCLLGCPGLIVLFWLIAAGAPPLLGVVARSDYEGPAATAVDWLPSFGAAAVPELLSVVAKETSKAPAKGPPAGRCPPASRGLHRLIRLISVDADARRVLLDGLESGQVPSPTAATLLFAATGCGWNTANETRPGERLRAARALAGSCRSPSDARRAVITILLIFAHEDATRAFWPVDPGRRELATSSVAAATRPDDFAALLGGVLERPVTLSEDAEKRLGPRIALSLPSTPRIDLATLLRMIEGGFDATPAVAMIPGGGASIRVRAEDLDGLGVALVRDGDHLALITVEERLQRIVAAVEAIDGE